LRIAWTADGPGLREVAIAARTGRPYALGIEAVRDGTEPLPFGGPLEDPAHGLGRLRVDHDLLVRRDGVAVRRSAGGEAPLPASSHSAARVLADLEPLVVIDDAHHLRGQVEELATAHAVVGGPFGLGEPIGDPEIVLGIAGETGVVPRQQHIPLVDALEEAEKARPVVARCARDRGLFDHEPFHDEPATSLSEVAAAGDLIGG